MIIKTLEMDFGYTKSYGVKFEVLEIAIFMLIKLPPFWSTRDVETAKYANFELAVLIIRTLGIEIKNCLQQGWVTPL